VIAYYLENVVVFQIPRESKWAWREVGSCTFQDTVTRLSSCDTFSPDGVIDGKLDGLDTRESIFPTIS
jgi:hypothetical protein